MFPASVKLSWVFVLAAAATKVSASTTREERGMARSQAIAGAESPSLRGGKRGKPGRSAEPGPLPALEMETPQRKSGAKC